MFLAQVAAIDCVFRGVFAAAGFASVPGCLGYAGAVALRWLDGENGVFHGVSFLSITPHGVAIKTAVWHFAFLGRGSDVLGAHPAVLGFLRYVCGALAAMAGLAQRA